MKGIVRRPLASLTLHVRGVLFDMDGVLISSTGSDERSRSRRGPGRGSSHSRRDNKLRSGQIVPGFQVDETEMVSSTHV
jgi:phosphoglycolate phosphatase-like HAD superfamily hydrolase